MMADSAPDDNTKMQKHSTCTIQTAFPFCLKTCLMQKQPFTFNYKIEFIFIVFYFKI